VFSPCLIRACFITLKMDAYFFAPLQPPQSASCRVLRRGAATRRFYAMIRRDAAEIFLQEAALLMRQAREARVQLSCLIFAAAAAIAAADSAG